MRGLSVQSSLVAGEGMLAAPAGAWHRLCPVGPALSSLPGGAYERRERRHLSCLVRLVLRTVRTGYGG